MHTSFVYCQMLKESKKKGTTMMMIIIKKCSDMPDSDSLYMQQTQASDTDLLGRLNFPHIGAGVPFEIWKQL